MALLPPSRSIPRLYSLQTVRLRFQLNCKRFVIGGMVTTFLCILADARAMRLANDLILDHGNSVLLFARDADRGDGFVGDNSSRQATAKDAAGINTQGVISLTRPAVVPR